MRGTTVGFGAVVWLAWLGALACGNAASPGTPANGGVGASGGSGVAGTGAVAGTGSAGVSGGAGGVGGAGGSNAGTGGLVLGDSKTEACIAYAVAVCQRQSECGGSRSDCLRGASLRCPDVVFSPGSTRTVAGLKACADAYAKVTCEQLDSGKFPDCVTPGTVALDRPCVYPSQCASLSCDTSNECGVCAAVVPEGEACTSDAQCAGFLVCTDGKCQRRSGSSSMGQALGDPCSSAAELRCQAGLRCDAATSKCAAYPTLGMSCADTRSCGGDSYCELDGLTCKAYPGEGLACGVDGFTGRASYCAAPLACNRSGMAVGTCAKFPHAGQPCLLDPETSVPEYVACDTTARCDATQSPPTCLSKSAKGQACQLDLDCAAGLFCLCSSGQSSCDAKVCGQLQLKGQPCAQPGDICHPGFSCIAGACEPRDSQGLFAAACGP